MEVLGSPGLPRGPRRTQRALHHPLEWGQPSSRASHASPVWMPLRALKTLEILKTLKTLDCPLALVLVWASMKGVALRALGAARSSSSSS